MHSFNALFCFSVIALLAAGCGSVAPSPQNSDASLQTGGGTKEKSTCTLENLCDMNGYTRAEQQDVALGANCALDEECMTSGDGCGAAVFCRRPFSRSKTCGAPAPKENAVSLRCAAGTGAFIEGGKALLGEYTLEDASFVVGLPSQCENFVSRPVSGGLQVTESSDSSVAFVLTWTASSIKQTIRVRASKRQTSGSAALAACDNQQILPGVAYSALEPQKITLAVTEKDGSRWNLKFKR
jgi:hypothetical protein